MGGGRGLHSVHLESMKMLKKVSDVIGQREMQDIRVRESSDRKAQEHSTIFQMRDMTPKINPKWLFTRRGQPARAGRRRNRFHNGLWKSMKKLLPWDKHLTRLKCMRDRIEKVRILLEGGKLEISKSGREKSLWKIAMQRKKSMAKEEMHVPSRSYKGKTNETRVG